MTLLLATIALYLGWTCVATSQGGTRFTWWLRCLGVALAAVALGLCVHRDGVAFGMLLWTCLLSVNAYAVVLSRAWRPR